VFGGGGCSTYVSLAPFFVVVDGYVHWYRWCKLSNIVGTGRVLAMVLRCCICYLSVPRGVFYGVSRVCGWLHFPL
jgi:hypothetical protein